MSFSSGLISIYWLPSQNLRLRLSWPRSRTLYLALLNFMRFTQAHLSRYLWMASLPSSVSTAPRNLVSLGKLAEGALNPTVHITDKDVKQQNFISKIVFWIPVFIIPYRLSNSMFWIFLSFWKTIMTKHWFFKLYKLKFNSIKCQQYFLLGEDFKSQMDLWNIHFISAQN